MEAGKRSGITGKGGRRDQVEYRTVLGLGNSYVSYSTGGYLFLSLSKPIACTT